MSNKFYSTDFKYEVLMAYRNEGYTLEKLTSRYQIPVVTLYNWLKKFEKDGISGLEDSKTQKSYSKELKKWLYEITYQENTLHTNLYESMKSPVDPSSLVG